MHSQDEGLLIPNGQPRHGLDSWRNSGRDGLVIRSTLLIREGTWPEEKGEGDRQSRFLMKQIFKGFPCFTSERIRNAWLTYVRRGGHMQISGTCSHKIDFNAFFFSGGHLGSSMSRAFKCSLWSAFHLLGGGGEREEEVLEARRGMQDESGFNCIPPLVLRPWVSYIPWLRHL